MGTNGPTPSMSLREEENGWQWATVFRPIMEEKRMGGVRWKRKREKEKLERREEKKRKGKGEKISHQLKNAMSAKNCHVC